MQLKTTDIQRVVEAILLQFGLHFVAIHSAESGYRNHAVPVELSNGESIICLLYKNEPSTVAIQSRATKVGDFCAMAGIPARQSYDRRTVQIDSKSSRRYAHLYSFLPGVTIPWDSYTKEQIKNVGGMMAQTHSVLRVYDLSDLPHVEDIYTGIIEKMRAYFTDQGVIAAMSSKLGLTTPLISYSTYTTLLQACKQLEGRQALHMDFVRGNILFFPNSDTISGVIDFEKTAQGHRLFDIARTYAFLLVDCKYKSSQQITKYFLYSGYRKRGRIKLPQVTVQTSTQTHNLLDVLTDLFLVYDLYKFMCHNPYESLAHNEHYIRTKDELLRRKLLSEVK